MKEVTQLQEGIIALDQIQVKCERLRHSLNVMEERLDELEAAETTRRRSLWDFFRRNQ